MARVGVRVPARPVRSLGVLMPILARHVTLAVVTLDWSLRRRANANCFASWN